MDAHYDSKGAAQRLQTIAQDRYDSAHSGLQLSRVVSIGTHYEASLSGRNWKLAHRTQSGEACSEEVVAIFQGVICKKDLPPFTDKLGANSGTQARYLRQSVTITGLQTPIFDKVVDTVADIHTVLARAAGIEFVQDCTMISSYQGARTLELSNRYFTSQNGGNTGQSNNEITLSKDIDPYGFLAKAAASANLYHGEENAVAYYEREGDSDSNYKYKDAKPVIFGIGDIVEVHTSFMTFPLKEKRAKTAMVLRGLTLLDGRFTQARARSIIVSRPLQASVTLKRKVGYSDEQMSSTRAALNEMEIDVARETKFGESRSKDNEEQHQQRNRRRQEDLD